MSVAGFNVNEDDDEAWLYGANSNEDSGSNTEQTNMNIEKSETIKDDSSNLLKATNSKRIDFPNDFLEEDQVPKLNPLDNERSNLIFEELDDTKEIKDFSRNDSNLNEINYDDEQLQENRNLANNFEDILANTADVAINNEKPKFQEDDEEEDDEEDDDDDINVKVVISDIVNKPYSTQQSTGSVNNGTNTAANLLNRQKPGQLTAQSTTSIVSTTGAAAALKVPTKGVDLDAPGLINDAPTFEYDLQEVKDEDKPWRKPGADITDYFNYGFTEESWIGYCMKQKRIRAENSNFKSAIQLIHQQPPIMNNANMNSGISLNQTNTGMQVNGMNASIPPIHNLNQMQSNSHMLNYQNKMNQPPFQPRFSGQHHQNMPPGSGMMQPRKIGQIGTIDVIGSSDSTSRRQLNQMGYPDQPNNENYLSIQPHVSMPDFSAPPPGFFPGAVNNGGPPISQPPPQVGMMPRIQQIPPPRLPPPHVPPPQIQSSPGLQIIQQQSQSGFQSSPYNAPSYQFPPPSGVAVIPPPIHQSNEARSNIGSLQSQGYSYPPPFNRGPGGVPPPANMMHPLANSSSIGPTWEKPATVEQQPYFSNEHNMSPSHQRRSSRSSTPGINSPRSRHSKSPQHHHHSQSHHQLASGPPNENNTSKYNRDIDGKSSYKNRRDYSSRDHRRSPSSPSRRSYRHRDHDRRGGGDYDRRGDYRDRSRDKSRDRSRERSRDKSRERSRSRDDKYKRRRKSSNDDDYRSSSKTHKRSKKSSRKEKESTEKDLSVNNPPAPNDPPTSVQNISVKQE